MILLLGSERSYAVFSQLKDIIPNLNKINWNCLASNSLLIPKATLPFETLPSASKNPEANPERESSDDFKIIGGIFWFKVLFCSVNISLNNWLIILL